MPKMDRTVKEAFDRDYAEMAAAFTPRPPDPKLERVEREYKQARKLRLKLQAITGRLPNRNRQPLDMVPVGREPKWTPGSSDPDWYTPQELEHYSWEGSRYKGLMSMKESHARNHSEFPHRGNRPVIGCLACKSSIYRRHRRAEMKQDVASWLGKHCYLCGENKTPGEFRTVSLWGGRSSIGHRLYHAAGDIEGEVRDNYVLVCHPCYKDGGRMKVYEKVRQTTALALPPPRQGRHPKGLCIHPGCSRPPCKRAHLQSE